MKNLPDCSPSAVRCVALATDSRRADRRSRHGVQVIGPDHKIVVDAHDDPKVAGVTCYVSRAKTGGIKGGLGWPRTSPRRRSHAGRSDRSRFAKPLPAQEEVFNERISLVFKKLRIVRMVDKPRNTLVYLTYSDRVIEGSPQNSVTAVPVDRATPIPVK